MFRTTRLSIALGLALAGASLAALPASAQEEERLCDKNPHIPCEPTQKPAPAPTQQGGTIRKHGAPPAPTPTIDRDQRTNYPRAGDPVQWDLKQTFCYRGVFYNARRAGVTSSTSSLGIAGSTTKWVEDGGDWLLNDLGDGTAREFGGCNGTSLSASKLFSLYSMKTNRYLVGPNTVSSKPAKVWSFRNVKSAPGSTALRFALFNVKERRYLVICEGRTVVDGKKKLEDLCYDLGN